MPDEPKPEAKKEEPATKPAEVKPASASSSVEPPKTQSESPKQEQPPKTSEPGSSNGKGNKLVEDLAEKLRAEEDHRKKLEERLAKLENPPSPERRNIRPVFKAGFKVRKSN